MRCIPFLPLLLAGCATGPADLVLLHGTIHTVDPELGTVEALAVRGDRILAIQAPLPVDSLRAMIRRMNAMER